MNNSGKKISKIYCERCDSIFQSREKFDEHFETIHSSNVSCEECPIDTILSKIVGLFKKKQDI